MSNKKKSGETDNIQVSAKNITSRVSELIAETINGFGLILWEVTFNKEGTIWNLCITIDRVSGVSLDDCELVHRAIDPLLDNADLIKQSYTLEVTSPGLNRALNQENHFKRYLNSRVIIKLFTKIKNLNAKIVKGILNSYNDGDITVKIDGVFLIDGDDVITLTKKLYAGVEVDDDI